MTVPAGRGPKDEARYLGWQAPADQLAAPVEAEVAGGA